MSERPEFVNLKLRSAAAAADVVPRAEATPGVLALRQTFPDEQDEELRRLYVVTVDPAALERVLDELQALPGVESAERAAPRRLMRP